MIPLVITFILLSRISGFVSAYVQCRDENNNPVDWYVVSKFPKMSGTQPFVEEGKGYMYMTKPTVDKGWQVSTKPIDSNSTLFANTLSFLNDSPSKIMWFIYNDQGNETCYDCGHTKGVIAGDKNAGFWLVHSIPHFLEGIYPKSGLTYGQSALCISLKQNMLDSVGDLLVFNNPKFQRWNIVNELKGTYPKILEAFNHATISEPWNLTKKLTSAEGTAFRAFAKSKQYGKDIYEWVASTLQQDVLTETWVNEAHVLPSFCNVTNRVLNLQSMKIPLLKNVEYTSHKDHSKLVIGDATPWICIGDINRAESQLSRGGGTVCLHNVHLWNAYRTLVGKVEQCKKNEFVP